MTSNQGVLRVLGVLEDRSVFKTEKLEKSIIKKRNGTYLVT